MSKHLLTAFSTPTAAQRRRLIDLLQQAQARRLKLRRAKRLTLCYVLEVAPDGMGEA